MTSYVFRPATTDDLDAVIALRTEAEEWLHAAGVEQWTADYHDAARDVLRTAVERGVAWAVEDAGAVAATVTLNGPDLDFWQAADAPDTGLYLSKMIVARSHAGLGLGAHILNWAAARAAWVGKQWLRLECRRDNLALHAYYQRHGFAHLRTVKPARRRTQSGALFQRAAGTIQPTQVEGQPVEYMTIVVEVWPVAADATGVWLLGPDALRADLPVPADSDPLFECKLLLARHGINQDHLIEIHGTSTRTDGPVLLATHYAAVDCPGPLIEHWPHAQPIDLTLAQSVGPAPSHQPTDIPTPRDIDVLLHALRHLWARLGYDQDAIDTYADRPLWAQHLQGLAPALSRMYGAEYRPGEARPA